MTIQPLSQRDKRWTKVLLGFSKYTLGSHGCTLTALCMLINYIYSATYTPDQINSILKELGEYHPTKNKYGAFQGALLVWSNVYRKFPKLKHIKRAFNYSNIEVALYVYVYKLPVLVEVNASSIGAPRHWVLFIGGGKMNDPWTGKEEKTSKYPLTGYSLYQKA